MTDDYVLESDMVGVRPWLMGQLQLILMMFLPLGTIPIVVYHVGYFATTVYSSVPYGLLWYFDSLNLSFNTLWLDSYYLLHALPIIVLNLIFIIEIVGYYNAMVSRRRVIIVGILSFLIPLIISTTTMMVFPIPGVYIGPLPFLLFTGLLLLYRIPGPEKIPLVYLSEVFTI